MINAEEIRKQLEDAQPQIIADLKAKLVEQIVKNYGWEFDSLVKKTVNDFYAEHIAPALVEHLASQRGVILQGVKDGSATIGAALAAAMVKQATEALTGYKGGDLLQRLMGKF